jgi:hypothetical protein
VHVTLLLRMSVETFVQDTRAFFGEFAKLRQVTITFYYGLLTVRLSTILVTDQLNAQILVLHQVYYIPLHVSITVVFIIRRSKLYYTASGIITLKQVTVMIPVAV